MSFDDISDNLLELSKEKLGLLEQVINITKKQKELLVEGQEENFLLLCKLKQLLLNRIKRLDDLFQEKYNSIKSSSITNFSQVLSKQLNLKDMQEIILQIDAKERLILQFEAENNFHYRQTLAQERVDFKNFVEDKRRKITLYKKIKELKDNKHF